MRISKIILAVCWLAAFPLYADTSVTNIYPEDKTAITASATQPEFIIKLKSNPTTGYSWFLRDYNSNLVAPVKHSFVAPTDKKLVGASGYEWWTFKVKPAALIVPQQTTIQFVYVRPWESVANVTPKVFTLTTVGGR